MFRAFFDESWTDRKSGITIVAGYVASEDTWDEVEKNWEVEFRRYYSHGISSFHMTDIVSGTKQYAAIDSPNRNHLITQMAKIVGASAAVPIFTGVSNCDFFSMQKSPEFQSRFPNPLSFCFEAIVVELLLWAREKVQNENLNMIYSFSEEHAPKELRMLRNIYQKKNWYGKAISSILFHDMEEFLGLQAADLLAHQMSNHLKVSSILSGQTYALNWATNGRSPFGGWYEAEALARADQQLNETGMIYCLS